MRLNHHESSVYLSDAPDADKLRGHYEGLPAQLRKEKINPQVPWLYGFELDFRFR